MKKSKEVSLILITAALASCNQPNKEWSSGEKHVYMRSDTSAQYSHAHTSGSGFLWYYAFRPYGNYNGGNYSRYGYYNDAISEHSNYSPGSSKSSVSRGGFGRGSFSASS